MEKRESLWEAYLRRGLSRRSFIKGCVALTSLMGLSTDMVSKVVEAVGDKAKLQRALVSLLESVAEQMPTNSVINLGCRADKASGNRVFLYFTIGDNESSIANELMQGMFEMKSEKDDPLRAGLYIAREIIGIMGGNVRVRSRRGEGTEFTVTVCMKLPGRA